MGQGVRNSNTALYSEHGFVSHGYKSSLHWKEGFYIHRYDFSVVQPASREMASSADASSQVPPASSAQPCTATAHDTGLACHSRGSPQISGNTQKLKLRSREVV